MSYANFLAKNVLFRAQVVTIRHRGTILWQKADFCQFVEWCGRPALISRFGRKKGEKWTKTGKIYGVNGVKVSRCHGVKFVPYISERTCRLRLIIYINKLIYIINII